AGVGAVFFVGLPLRLPRAQGPRSRGGETRQQPLVLLRELGGKFRRRLTVDQLFQADFAATGIRKAGERRLVEDGIAAPLLPAVAEHELVSLARGDGDQEPPEVVTVVQLREATMPGPPAEAIEGAQGHVLFVRAAARQAVQFLASQPDESLEIALPEILRGRRVPVPQPAEPLADRLIRRHRTRPPTGKVREN